MLVQYCLQDDYNYKDSKSDLTCADLCVILV